MKEGRLTHTDPYRQTPDVDFTSITVLSNGVLLMDNQISPAILYHVNNAYRGTRLSIRYQPSDYELDM